MVNETLPLVIQSTGTGMEGKGYYMIICMLDTGDDLDDSLGAAVKSVTSAHTQ